MYNRIKSYLDKVIQSGETIIVPRNNTNGDAVVIISLKEYNALQETDYLLSNKANRQNTEEAIAQLNAGPVFQFPIESLESGKAS